MLLPVAQIASLLSLAYIYIVGNRVKTRFTIRCEEAHQEWDWREMHNYSGVSRSRCCWLFAAVFANGERFLYQHPLPGFARTDITCNLGPLSVEEVENP
ncbi:hypothetical protein OROHE_006008 [Orobanche hederae]